MNPQPDPTTELTREVTDLKGEITALRQVLATAIAAMLALTLALNGVFLWQSRVVRRQLTTARTELSSYQRAALPVINEFLNRLETFAVANPDFAPVLGKYAPMRTNTSLRIDPKLSPKR